MWPFGGRFFPGTNLNDLNLDWIIKRMRELTTGIIAPYINGDNKHWMEYDVNQEQFVDSGILAEGATGPAGKSPYVNNTTGTWFVYDDTQNRYVDTNIPATGPEGKPPYIDSTTGNWFEYDNTTQAYVDTGVHAQGETGARGAGSNDNMIDNAYFDKDNRINQRGQTTPYSLAPGDYCIDRWKLTGNTGAHVTVTLNDDNIQIASDGTANARFEQRYSASIDNPIPKGKYTLSALIDYVDLPEGVTAPSIRLLTETNYTPSGAAASFSEPGLVSVTFDLVNTAASNTSRRICIIVNAGTTIRVRAIKLEPGDTSTLANNYNGTWQIDNVPNPAVSLLRCQKYLQLFRTQSLRHQYGADYRPVMATDEPDITSSIQIGTVTYYMANSEP